MAHVTLPDEWVEKLLAVGGKVTLLDANGRVVGEFTPPSNMDLTWNNRAAAGQDAADEDARRYFTTEQMLEMVRQWRNR